MFLRLQRDKDHFENHRRVVQFDEDSHQAWQLSRRGKVLSWRDARERSLLQGILHRYQ